MHCLNKRTCRVLYLALGALIVLFLDLCPTRRRHGYQVLESNDVISGVSKKPVIFPNRTIFFTSSVNNSMAVKSPETKVTEGDIKMIFNEATEEKNQEKNGPRRTDTKRLDTESLQFRINISAEESLAIKGGPYDPLSAYKSTCWIARLPSDLDILYQDNPYKYRCINGGKGQDHCRQDFGKLQAYVYSQRMNFHYSQFKSNRSSLPSGNTMKSVSSFQRVGRGPRGVFPEPNETYTSPWRVRCLPYVYLVGVTKSGTTDLFDKMILHPDIVAPSMKEPMYFNRNRLGSGFSHTNFSYSTFSHYVDLFDMAAYEIETSTRKNESYHQKITLDGTPCYFWDYDGWRDIPGNQGLDEPLYTLPLTLHAVNPHAKVIVILRDPSDRLYSHYRMRRGRGVSPGDFHEIAKRGIELFKSCIASRTIRACAYDPMFGDEKSEGLYLRASLYSVFLRDYFAAMPRNNILVLRGEDYYSDRKHTLNKVFRFLDIAPMSDATMEKALATRVQNSRNYEDMLDKTRDSLTEFFSPFNYDLSKLLNDQSFLWNS